MATDIFMCRYEAGELVSIETYYEWIGRMGESKGRVGLGYGVQVLDSLRLHGRLIRDGWTWADGAPPPAQPDRAKKTVQRKFSAKENIKLNCTILIRGPTTPGNVRTNPSSCD